MCGVRPSMRYVLGRLRGALFPPVRVTPLPTNVRFERDVTVTVRDGTILRVNVFRPAAVGRYPVIMCAHPYGKDAFSRPRRFGFAPTFLRHPAPYSVSAWTSWEAPDPVYWTAHGYAVVNCDLRGFHRSDGTGTVLSEQEAEDYYDLIEWAGVQPWSNGKVGLNGVSYLAISQYKVAALHPPHLAAICPWEGFSDWYRDFARPGGIREDGFMRIWSAGLQRQGRTDENPRADQLAHPLHDDWWAARMPNLAQITVPILICGSFSDHCLHSRGAFRAFERVGSRQRWLYTHRGGKWSTYYSEDALRFQRRFFDHFLKGVANGMQQAPPVRLEVRADRDTIHEVRGEPSWPLPTTHWTALMLHPDGRLAPTAAVRPDALAFDTRHGCARFRWASPEDLELTGPMALRLHIEARGASDVHLFVRVHKMRERRVVPFEGSYGFGYDHLATGWLKASHRTLDAQHSTPWQPVHTHTDPQPLRPGEVVAVEIALLPSSTYFRAGEELVLEVAGCWFHPWNPLWGHFPATYEPSPRGTCVLHCGGAYDAQLIVPRIARAQRPGL